MKSTNIIFLVIVGLILLGLGYGFGYATLKQEQAENFTLMPRFPLIQEWRSSAGGDVLEITEDAIIISSEGATLTLSLSGEVEVNKTVQKEDEIIEETTDLSLQDINVGDTISLVITADTEGNLRAKVINIFEFQEE